MINLDDFIAAYARNLGVIKRQVAGLSHEECLLQPPFRGNCMNWVLGHIAEDRNAVLKALGQEPVFTEAQRKRYGYGSEPVCEDGEDVLKLDALVLKLEQAQERIEAALRQATPQDLAREVESHLGTTTLGQFLFFRCWHETYHTGQTELLRQVAGTDDKVI